MQCLAQATGDLTEAQRWGRQATESFHRLGDHIYAANTLFIMAQRAIYAGVGSDDVHLWLNESMRLAQRAGSEKDQVHATVGFGRLAGLRGDRDHAPARRRRLVGRSGGARCQVPGASVKGCQAVWWWLAGLWAVAAVLVAVATGIDLTGKRRPPASK